MWHYNKMEEQTQPRVPSKEYIQNCKMKLQRNTRNQLLEKTEGQRVTIIT